MFDPSRSDLYVARPGDQYRTVFSRVEIAAQWIPVREPAPSGEYDGVSSSSGCAVASDRPRRHVDLPERRALVVAAKRILDASVRDAPAIARPRDLRREDAAGIGRCDRPGSARQPVCGAASSPQRSRGGRRALARPPCSRCRRQKSRARARRIGGHVGELASVRAPRGVDDIALSVC